MRYSIIFILLATFDAALILGVAMFTVAAVVRRFRG